MHLVDRPSVGESNGLPDGSGQAYHDQWANARTVDWTEPHLRVTRLRLLSDPGLPWWDVSYCHGVLCHTHEFVRVELPFSQLPKRGFKWAIVQHAKRDRIYAHQLGVLTNISTLC
jgi:hypothetical protein